MRFDFEAMEEDSDKEEDGDYTPDNRNYNPYLAFDNLSVEGSDAESSFGIVDGSDAGSDVYVSGDDSDFDPDYDNEALEQFIEDEFFECNELSDVDSNVSMGNLSDADYSDDKLDQYDYVAEPKEKDRFIECRSDHPSARHRYRVRADEWVQITIGYLLCFFGILIIIAALKVRFWRIPWMESEGLGLAFIQNAMSKNRFDQIRRYIHFVNNRRLVSKGNRNWSPLQKINPFIEKMLERFRACYTMGQFMSIDGSMIKYKGKQIRFIQYMPAKPIKHGIKVFVLSCAETGYCYGFLIYCGKENDTSTPIEIVAKLFEQESDFIGSSAGRVVYMDNYYTSLTMIDYMYKQYKAFVVGTIALTKKKSRDSNDFPFHKLSGPATKKVGKGWLRIAQKKVFDSSGKVLKYIVQATTWMDRKQVRQPTELALVLLN